MEEIFIPASGMALEDVLLSEWLKQPGDEVSAGEPVAVVETDKAIMELSAIGPGRLSRHLFHAGDRVPGGTTVAYVLGEGESEPVPSAGGLAPATAGADTDGGPVAAGGPVPAGGEPAPTGPRVAEREADGRHTLSPRARRALAGAASVSTVVRGPSPSVAGTGVGRAAESTGRVPTAAGAASGNRQATAALVSESWRTVPHFSVGRDVRADGLLDAVASAKAGGTPVTITDFFSIALARALGNVGEAPDVGLAVATDWGVLIPVLRSLAGRSLADVAALRQAAVGRARSRRLEPADTAPVFATLSNLAPQGSHGSAGLYRSTRSPC